MRVFVRLCIAGIIALGSMGHSYAEGPSGTEAARSVIQSQLSAFADEEIGAAYGYAAPNIQRLFPTPEIFGRMVREGYPMVWSPSETSFLDADQSGDAIVQRLRIVDQAGDAFIAEYILIRIDGEWRIAGVQIRKDDPYGV